VCAVVTPEESAANQKEKGEDREFNAGDALLTAVAVVPGNYQDDRQADQEPEP
jgi:hypothetical protein